MKHSKLAKTLNKALLLSLVSLGVAATFHVGAHLPQSIYLLLIRYYKNTSYLFHALLDLQG